MYYIFFQPLMVLVVCGLLWLKVRRRLSLRHCCLSLPFTEPLRCLPHCLSLRYCAVFRSAFH